MLKSNYQSSISKSQYIHKNKTKNNNVRYSNPKQEEFDEFEIDSDFYDDFNPLPPKNKLHKTTEHSFDEQRSRVTKTKIVKELNNSSSKKKQNTTTLSKKSKENKKSTKYKNWKNEAEKQKYLYKSPDYKSGSPFESPLFINDGSNFKDTEEMGYKTNYKFESKRINGKEVGTYSTKEKYEYINKNGKIESKYEKSVEGSPSGIEGISPLGYIENNLSGSDLDENPIKSVDNYQYSVRTTNTNRSNYSKHNKNRKKDKNNLKLNYQLEEPEMHGYLPKDKRKNSNDEIKKGSSRYTNVSNIRNKIEDSYTYTSEIKDFQSPDRKINEPQKFRKVNIGMIDSKGPSYEEKKISNVLTKEIVNTKKRKDEKIYTNEILIKKKKGQNNIYISSNDTKKRIEAAKIIQAWWRSRNYREEEVYDITVKSAIKLQSYIRGFLVRKKVLRYITLAIYYQSFCDKLQDVLCNYIKKIIFKLFKEKFCSNQKIKKIQRISVDIINKRRKALINIIENIIEKNVLYIIKILKKWKDIAYKVKNKSKYKIKEITKIIKPRIEYKTNKDDNKANDNNNISASQNMYIKEVKVKTVKSSTKKDLSLNINGNKSTKLTKSTVTDINKSNKYFSPTASTTKINYKTKKSPYTQLTTSNTKVQKRSQFSPYPIEKNIQSSYNNNLNKSYDKAMFKKEIERIRYTTTNETSNHKLFTRVDKSKEKVKRVSPEFGTLRKNNETQTQTTTYNKNTMPKKTEVKKTAYNMYKNNVKNIYSKKDDVDKKTTKKRIHNVEKKVDKKIENKKIKKYNTNIKTNIQRKQITTEEEYPVVKLSKRKTDSSFSIKTFSQGKESLTKTKSYKTYTEYNPRNKIDNQLSVSFIKIKDNNENNDTKLNKTNIDTPERVKYIEKVVFQKELEPETAEEAVGFQLFDMKISKRASLYIEPSTEIRQKIIDEQKELEIYKKRERENSKEIDRYKKDIENFKLKNLLDKLRRAIRTIESFKKRILQKKLYQYRNICLNKSFVLEIDPMDDWEITHKPKQKKDFSVQINSSEKKVRNFKTLKITRMYPVTYLFKKVNKPHRVTKSKLNIISQVKKKEQSQQSGSWNKLISPLKNNNINLSYSNKLRENSYKNNTIDDWKEIEILSNKPKMIDDEVQHEYEENQIEAESLEILRLKPQLVNTFSQYETDKPKISGKKNCTIVNKSVKKETKEAESNTVIDTAEQGINAIEEVEPKPKNVEIKIRTVKRSLTKMEIPLLKKLWLRKAFRTFRDNCNRPPFHLIIARELVRMALLRWRFIKGYGPDRYGNVYDRDGKLIYKTKAKVADFEMQNVEVIEQNEQSTQYVPEENKIANMKYIEIAPSYKKVIKKETKDQSVGNNIRLDEKIQKKESFYFIKMKKKGVNRISKNNFVILKKNKILKDKETQMPKAQNEIDKMDDFKVIDDEGFLKKKKNTRLKDLLTQILYKREMTEKLNLSEALRTWLKQTIILIHNEEIEIENMRRKKTEIKKRDRFALIEKKEKEETGTQMAIAKNKIQNTTKFNYIQNIKKKNAEINVKFPPEFDIGKIKPKIEKNITLVSSKKPIVLKSHKQNDMNMNIFSQDYIFREEVRRGIHHEMTEEAKKRVTEILYNFLMTRGDPNSLLRKYYTIWNRKTTYLSLIENARIISEFCKRNLYNLFNTRNWHRFGKKLLLKEKIQIIKLSKEITVRINKIFDLIRITRINSIFSKKRYLHLIIIAWLSYTRNIHHKLTHINTLYENMLTTYMNVADDVFGKNQKENPSVQDALFEAVDSTKFQTKRMQDVPLAKDYYSQKKTITTISKNIIQSYGTDENKDKDKETNKYKIVDKDKFKAKERVIDKVKTKEYTTYYNSTISSYPNTSIKVIVHDNSKKNINTTNTSSTTNASNRYNIINKYKNNQYKVNNEITKSNITTIQNKDTKISDSNIKGRTYQIRIEKEERTEPNEGKATYRNRSKERPEGRMSNISEKELERSESKGKMGSYKNTKIERSDSKGKMTTTYTNQIIERPDSKGKMTTTYTNQKIERSDSKGKMTTYTVQKIERSDSKGKMATTYTNQKIERSDSKGRMTYRNEKELERSESKGKIGTGTYKNTKIERSDSKGRMTYISEKEERSESKGKIETYKNTKMEKSDSKGRIHFIYEKDKKLEKSDSKGRFDKNKTMEKSESKGKLSIINEKDKKLEKSDSKGRFSYINEKNKTMEKSDSKGRIYNINVQDKEKERSDPKGKITYIYEKDKKLEKSDSKGRIYNINNQDKKMEKSESRGKIYNINAQDKKMEKSESRGKIYNITTQDKKMEKSESRGRIYNIRVEKEREGSDSKGKIIYYKYETDKSKEKERSDSKDRRTYKYEKEEKTSVSKGKTSTFKIRKEERIESSGKLSYRSEKEERSESKGKNTYRSGKDERSESKGRNSSSFGKKERSSSKGKGYIYKDKKDIDTNIDYKNHQYFESKKKTVKKGNAGNIEETISTNIITIKSIDKGDLKNNSLNENSMNNDDKTDKRQLSYGERRKLFRKRFLEMRRKEDNTS